MSTFQFLPSDIAVVCTCLLPINIIIAAMYSNIEVTHGTGLLCPIKTINEEVITEITLKECWECFGIYRGWTSKDDAAPR